MSATPTHADTLAVLQGGQRASAAFLDGRVEDVFVRQPPLRELPRYLELADDIPVLVEFACGKEAGWADTLTDDTVFALYHLARGLNDPRLGRWISARRQTAENLLALKRPSPSPVLQPAPSPGSGSPGTTSPP